MKKAKLNNSKKNKKEEIVQNNDITIRRVFISIVAIIIVFVSFYFFTDYLLSKRTNSDDSNNQVNETNNEISFNDLYNQSDDTYYVLAILESDENKEKYAIYENNITPLYYIDMNDAFNKSHIGDKVDVSEKVKDIVINDTTLFVIKDNKLNSYHVGYANITKYIISNIKVPVE